MDKSIDLAGTVRRAILLNKTFKLVTPKNGIRIIELLENEKTNDKEYRRWQIAVKKGTVVLQLFDDNIRAILSLSKEGLWAGRERESNATLMLRPLIENEASWKRFFRSNRYEKADKEESFEEQVRKYVYPSGEQEVPELFIQSKKSGETALVLVGCDRVDYWKRTVDSIKANKPEYPIYAFIDKKFGEEGTEQEEQAEYLTALFPEALVELRTKNWGCGRNIIDARRQIFDSLGYERAFIFEDDLVVASNYIKTCLSMLRWAEQRYENVGAVQAWHPCLHSRYKKIERWGHLEATFVNLWAYLMTKACWKSISPSMYFLEKSLLKGFYRERPHDLIRHWIKNILLEEPTVIRSRAYPVTLSWQARREQAMENIPGGQDGTTSASMVQQGWVRLATQANRAVYIGERGIHMNSQRYRQAGFQSMVLDEYEVIPDYWIPSDSWNPPTLMEGIPFI